MPLIAYVCSCGHSTKKLVRQVKDAPALLLCEHCNTENMKKTLSAPSSTSKISVDNGVQARAVEINPDIIAINHERANKNYRED
jgi:hypothetical protein